MRAHPKAPGTRPGSLLLALSLVLGLGGGGSPTLAASGGGGGPDSRAGVSGVAGGSGAGAVDSGGGATPSEGWRRAAPGFPWSFPRDHWAHPDTRSEWWYLTGHLETPGPEPRRLGYQFTFFRVGLLREVPDHASPGWATRSLVMGHAALSDLDAREHRFSEVLYRASPSLGGFSREPDPVLAWSLAPPGTPGKWTLAWNGEGFEIRMRDDTRGFALELTTRPEKPRIFQGPGGVSQKSRDGTVSSLYYSFPRLHTEGRVILDGQSLPVRGRSWFDKEFGSGELGEDQAGWDWFSLQLADGQDLMLYHLRGEDGGLDFGRGTLVARDGSVRYLEPRDWELTPRGSWASPENDAVYPQGWDLRVPGEGLRLRIEAAFPAQENRSQRLPGMAYWEGAVGLTTADGEDAGRGYVELTGYGRARRPTR